MREILLVLGIVAFIGSAVGAERKSAEQFYDEAVELKYSDKAKSLLLFIEAAKGKHPKACGIVAELAENEGFPYQEFGETRNEAKIHLLRIANEQGTPRTAWQLGKGLVKSGELNEGLKMLKDASESGLQIAWSGYYTAVFANPSSGHEVEDGYFFLVADLQFLDPDSIASQNAWDIRREIASKLSPTKLKEIHSAVDEWISKTEIEKVVSLDLRTFGQKSRSNASEVEKEFRASIGDSSNQQR